MATIDDTTLIIGDAPPPNSNKGATKPEDQGEPNGEKSEFSFYSCHKPPLTDGEHVITVSQILQLAKDDHDRKIFKTVFKFHVSGERFSIDPSALHAVFPPSGSIGSYDKVLPHIAIKRSSFPWERSAGDAGDDTPWLAILLFNEDEIRNNDVVQQIVTLEKIRSAPVNLPEYVNVKNGKMTKADFPDFKLDSGDKNDDKVSVIDVKKSLLEKIIPTGDECRLLTHVRKRKDGQELAVIVGNRFPESHSSNTAFLISVENRFKNSVFDFGKTPDGNAIDENTSDDAYIRLVTLKSWSFNCSSTSESDESFDRLINNLNKGVLILPIKTDETIHKYLSLGYLLLPHFLRNGQFTYSWYHSPLTSKSAHLQGAGTITNSEVQISDQLLRVDSETGMMDITYAAAFELGRVLAMDSTTFVKTLYDWKHKCKLYEHDKTQRSCSNIDGVLAPKGEVDQTFELNDTILTIINYLKNDGVTSSTDNDEKNQSSRVVEQLNKIIGDFKIDKKIVRKDLPIYAIFLKWLDEISQFKHIPFNYLVPDERLLPFESIRFFQVDTLWLEALYYGAFNIGTPLNDESVSKSVAKKLFQINDEPVCKSVVKILFQPFLKAKSGCLIRSTLIAGYPDLAMEAFAKDNRKCTLIRKERLASDILFCLFSDTITTVELNLKSEGLHFSIDDENRIHDNFPNIKFVKGESYKVLHYTDENGSDVNKKISSAEIARHLIPSLSKFRFVVQEGKNNNV
jgi:hypothetical protein